MDGRFWEERFLQVARSQWPGAGYRSGSATYQTVKERAGGNGSRLWNVCTHANGGHVSICVGRGKRGVAMTPAEKLRETATRTRQADLARLSSPDWDSGLGWERHVDEDVMELWDELS